MSELLDASGFGGPLQLLKMQGRGTRTPPGIFHQHSRLRRPTEGAQSRLETDLWSRVKSRRAFRRGGPPPLKLECQQLQEVQFHSSAPSEWQACFPSASLRAGVAFLGDRPDGYGALFRVVATDVNWALSALPNEPAPTIIAKAMSAAIKPYSMAVAPDSSRRNFATSCIFSSPYYYRHKISGS